MVTEQTEVASEMSTDDAALFGEFCRLTAQWKEETMGDSIGLQVLAHPAHLRIIGMGARALPWILRDLADEGGHWYAALQAITGENPVSEEDAGRRPRMRALWLELGRQRGWID